MTGVLKVDDIQDAGANSIVSSNGSGTLTFGNFTAATITASTALVPDASDGAALGTTALEWSDLFLADGAVINFGDDQEVTLTHVADTGLLISSTDQLQFGDSGTYIHQSADGVLDLVSDTEIELNATTLDINANVEISGTAVTTGVHTFTAVPVFPNNTVESADIQADAITGAKIADDAINSEHYTDGSIDTAHLADGQVTIGKLATAVLTGATDIGAAIADADLLLVDDAAGGTLRKTTALRLFDYIGGKSKLFEGTFGSRTTGTISLSSMGFVPTAAHCIFAPNATTNATDEDNISIGFAVKTGATSSAHAVAYNYLQQSGTSAFDANPDVLGRLAFGSATFHNLTITAWNDDDCTLTKAVNGTPADVTLKYAIIVTG